MFIGKLTKALFGFCLLLCLSACSDRAEFEKRFAKVGEVYPTENVSDLFKKFPDGFHIWHVRFEYRDGKEYLHSIGMDGYPATKKITGEYEKSYTDDNGQEIVEFDRPVDYVEGEGLKFTDGSEMDSFMTNFEFAFEWLAINQEQLSQLDYNGVTENPVSGDYGVYYRITDKLINKKLAIGPEIELLDLSLKGDFSMDKDNKFALTMHISEIRETDSTQYLWEQVYERNRNEE